MRDPPSRWEPRKASRRLCARSLHAQCQGPVQVNLATSGSIDEVRLAFLQHQAHSELRKRPYGVASEAEAVPPPAGLLGAGPPAAPGAAGRVAPLGRATFSAGSDACCWPHPASRAIRDTMPIVTASRRISIPGATSASGRTNRHQAGPASSTRLGSRAP